MGEEELVKAGMEVMLRPVTDIAENTLGLLGGDWLSEKRARNRARLKQKTEEILHQRKVTMDADPSPTTVIPLLVAAQDESREELANLWAALLAAGSDPARRSRYRREFVDIAKQLEPVDAVILKAIGGPSAYIQANQIGEFGRNHSLSRDQLEISFDKLEHLGLVQGGSRRSAGAILPTSLAREMCFAIGD